MKIYKLIFISLMVAFLATGCMTISTSGDYNLRGDRTLRGDLIITSGEATLEEGSRVTGNVYMTSGTLNVDGEVDGDIVFSSAKSINLGPSSVVEGDIKGTSGNVYQADGSKVAGEISTDQTFTLGTGFFAQAFGLLCGIPLAIIGSIIYVLSGRRNKRTETSPAMAVFGAPDITNKLKQLKQMREEGLISQEDYEAKKSAILENL